MKHTVKVEDIQEYIDRSCWDCCASSSSVEGGLKKLDKLDAGDGRLFRVTAGNTVLYTGRDLNVAVAFAFRASLDAVGIP